MGDEESHTVEVSVTALAGNEEVIWVHLGRGQLQALQGDQLIRIIVTGIQNEGEEEEMKDLKRVHLNLTGWRRRRRQRGRRSGRRRRGRRRRRRHQRRRKNGTGTVMGVKEPSRREGKGKKERRRGVRGTEMERTGKRVQAEGERCHYLDKTCSE